MSGKKEYPFDWRQVSNLPSTMTRRLNLCSEYSVTSKPTLFGPSYVLLQSSPTSPGQTRSSRPLLAMPTFYLHRSVPMCTRTQGLFLRPISHRHPYLLLPLSSQFTSDAVTTYTTATISRNTRRPLSHGHNSLDSRNRTSLCLQNNYQAKLGPRTLNRYMRIGAGRVSSVSSRK